MNRKPMPPDDGLKEPIRKFEDTFSAEDCILDDLLAKRIEGNLPQRVVSVDTGEKADCYSLWLSMDERKRLIRALRRT